jgi:cytochrome c556
MVARKDFTPEVLAEAKRLYEQTLAPVDDICGALNIARPKFYRLAKEHEWRGRRAKTAPFHFARALTAGSLTALLPEPVDQPRAEILPRGDQMSPEHRAAMRARVFMVAEQQMEAVARIVRVIAPQDQIEAEHSARTLANLSRTMREVSALFEPTGKTPQEDAAEDDIPHDIDEFRRELARRIRIIVDAGRDAVPESPDATSDGADAG